MSIEVSALFNLYYDFVKHGNYGEINYKSKETYYLYTMNKELKNKYDSTFKMKYIYNMFFITIINVMQEK